MAQPASRPPVVAGISPAKSGKVRHLQDLLRSYFMAGDAIRRGVCLLNAGRYSEAAVAFSQASVYRPSDRSLARYLAACYLGNDDAPAAVPHLATASATDPSDVTAQVRHALALRAAGESNKAIEALRTALAATPESAELHFQLGTLVADLGDNEEAELRFVQAHNIDAGHAEALVSLALCCAVRHAPIEAIRHLRAAQTLKPTDARIGELLAHAAEAAQQQGQRVCIQAAMPDDQAADDLRGIEELSGMIEADPDFVDAFLSLPVQETDKPVFAMLLRTLERALEKQPEHAELHFHCGRVLDRLGRRTEAIHANERAVGINPKFTRALIELGRLYHETDRKADATTRLEQAVATGGDYADVFYSLGNLYRDQGQIARARRAYHRALALNTRYDDARKALDALCA